MRLQRLLLFPAAILLLSIPVDGNDAQMHWVASWAASPQQIEPNNALAPADARDVTLRQIVRLTLGGGRLRLRLSNRFGDTPLHLTSVHIAGAVSPASEKIVPGTDKPLTFSGSSDVTIPAHADYLSDSVTFLAPDLSDIAITLHVDKSPDTQTGHPGSRATSYIKHGDVVPSVDFASDAKLDHWYYISGIDVMSASGSAAIVILGDSITDGHGATTNANDRWPDVLAERLKAQPSTRGFSVINQGIGGNHLLTDGVGLNALARFDQDVIAQPAVRFLIVLEGINDVGLLARKTDVTAEEHELQVRLMIAALQQIIDRAHTNGIKVIGATIMPFVGSDYYHPGPANEADRQAFNAWIRTSGHFDALIDFDKLTADPEHPDRLLPAYDIGDHLHPSPAGYAAMGRGVPLSLFVPVSGSAP